MASIGGSGVPFACGKVFDWIAAMGWAVQRLMIVPSLNMVVLVNAWTADRMNLPEAVLLNQLILPGYIGLYWL